MKKIIIIGNCGSGKSIFAEQLADCVNLPAIHLDSIFWLPDYTRVSKKVFDKKLSAILQREAWIIDGNYERTLVRRLEKSDTVIFFDYPRGLCFYRAIKRYLKAFFSQDSSKFGNPPRFSRRFAIQILFYPRKKIFKLITSNLNHNQRLIVFKSTIEAENFLKLCKSGVLG